MEALDRFNRWIGRAIAWMTALMVLNTVLVIAGRDLFGFGRIWMQLGAADTLSHDEHVRVDIINQRLSKRGRAIVDGLGTLLLLIPTCLYLLFSTWNYVFGPLGSWATREASGQAGGLPFPAPAILKTFMIVMPFLLLLLAAVIIARSISYLREARK